MRSAKGGNWPRCSMPKKQSVAGWDIMGFRSDYYAITTQIRFPPQMPAPRPDEDRRRRIRRGHGLVRSFNLVFLGVSSGYSKGNLVDYSVLWLSIWLIHDSKLSSPVIHPKLWIYNSLGSLV